MIIHYFGVQNERGNDVFFKGHVDKCDVERAFQLAIFQNKDEEIQDELVENFIDEMENKYKHLKRVDNFFSQVITDETGDIKQIYEQFQKSKPFVVMGEEFVFGVGINLEQSTDAFIEQIEKFDN